MKDEAENVQDMVNIKRAIVKALRETMLQELRERAKAHEPRWAHVARRLYYKAACAIVSFIVR